MCDECGRISLIKRGGWYDANHGWFMYPCGHRYVFEVGKDPVLVAVGETTINAAIRLFTEGAEAWHSETLAEL